MCMLMRGPPYLGEDLFLFELSELGNCSLQVEASFVCHTGHFARLLKVEKAESRNQDRGSKRSQDGGTPVYCEVHTGVSKHRRETF